MNSAADIANNTRETMLRKQRKASKRRECGDLSDRQPIPTANSAISPHGASHGGAGSRESEQIVNKIFSELKIICPAWKTAFPTDAELILAKKVWVKTLVESDITSIELIRFGLARARKSRIPFFPSPGQFVEWCKPSLEDLGLPSVDKAFTQACCNSTKPNSSAWTHPAVYVAGRETGWHALATKQHSQIFKAFERNYEIVCRLAQTGERFDKEIPKALPKRASRPLPKSEAMEKIKGLREIINKQ